MIKRRKWLCVIVILLAAVFCLIQNNWIMVSHYTYASSKIGEETEGYCIVQISDLHNKLFGAGQSYLMNKIQECEPDIIVVTGDVADSNHTNIGKSLLFFEEAVKIAPVYYVTGNHEHWLSVSEKEELWQGIEKAGVIRLDDECRQIATTEEHGFTIIGLDDRSLSDDTLEEVMEQVPENAFSLLLAHEPQYIEKYADCGVDLVLSGHAHGGQVRLPLLGGLVAPNQGLLPRYTEGIHTQGNTSMIISRGLGNSVIPLRVFNRPEIVCVELTKES